MFVVVTALVFWVVTTRVLVGRCRFEEQYCLHFQVWKWKWGCFSDMLVCTNKFTRHYEPEDQHLQAELFSFLQFKVVRHIFGLV